MATVNLGSIKFNWQGAYAGGTAYAVDDVVSYNGSSYVCTAASTGNLPTDTNFWDQMSGKGTDADLLNIASTVQGDLYYNNGSAIARLGAGTSGQFLKTQGTSANPTWGDVSSNHTGLAWFEYMYGTGSFGDMHSIAGFQGVHNLSVIPWNTLTDPYNIIGTAGSNVFQVNTTGAYEISFSFRMHQFNHYKIFLNNDTDGKYAERPNTALTGTQTFQAPLIGYNTGQGEVHQLHDFYYLETGHNYSFRASNDTGTSNFSTGTSSLLGNHTSGGVNSYNTIFRVKVTKLSGV